MLLLGVLASWGVQCRAAEFSDEVERDFALRDRGRLMISNLRGDVILQGWAQDKIRVKARRHVEAESKEEATRLLAALDFRHRVADGEIELSAEYGKGLEIQQRLRERKKPRTRMDMIVLAPANLRVRVWAQDGEVSVTGWNRDVEIRTAKGPIRINDVNAENVSILCPGCSVAANDLKASLRCIGGTGDATIARVQGAQIYVETTTGSQRLQRIEGEQLYLSRSGSISGKDLRGRIEFHTQRGDVEIVDSQGFASGNTDSGNITLRMREWNFADKALIESVRGNIAVALPSTLDAEVDLASLYGQAESAFNLRPLHEKPEFGPPPGNHLSGQIGEGGDQLKLFSRQGNVHLLRSL
jgi:hypothetical protein